MAKVVAFLCFVSILVISVSGTNLGEGRQVFPLIPLGGSFQGGGRPSGNWNPAPAPSGGGGGGGQREGVFVSSGGQRVGCKNHADCYPYREPDEWCPLPPAHTYREKGCWCDNTVGSCVIDRRQTSSGLEWTFCISKSVSKCTIIKT